MRKLWTASWVRIVRAELYLKFAYVIRNLYQYYLKFLVSEAKFFFPTGIYIYSDDFFASVVIYSAY
jgi:hypothetical protein